MTQHIDFSDSKAQNQQHLDPQFNALPTEPLQSILPLVSLKPAILPSKV